MYINKNTWNYISDSEYSTIVSEYRRNDFEKVQESKSNDFLSWIVSYATDSSILGYMVGWSLWGALIWDFLNDWDVI